MGKARVQKERSLAPFVQSTFGPVRKTARQKNISGENIQGISQTRISSPAGLKYLPFESLLSDLAVRFLQASGEKVDLEIDHALQEILQFFDLDRCGLFVTAGDRESWLLTHAAFREGIPPLPLNMEMPVTLFPWVYKRIVLEHEVMMFSSLHELPPEAVIDKETYTDWGIRSAASIPILFGGSLDYFLAITTDRRERTWPAEYVPRLRLLGEIMAHAAERRRALSAIRESECQYRLLAENSRDVIFTMDDSYRFTYISPSIRHLRGLTPEEAMTERFSETLTPQSREVLHKTFSEHSAGRGDTDVRLELEQKHKDGSSLWVEVVTQPIFGENGQRLGFSGMARDITERKKMEAELEERLADIDRLKSRLERENVYLREEVKLLFEHDDIVGESESVRRMLGRAEHVATTDSTVLIFGETGTGKELLARRIHEMSSRSGRSLVTVNCASLPPSLIESELFGREKGAYTGAMTRMAGRFEIADGSTLFLDEIGELPLELQGKLLRVLEYGQFERLGSTRTHQVNVRLITATNRDLAHEAAEGKFRKDLFYRLNVFPIVIPPLRERSEDIPALVWTFVRHFEKKLGRRVNSIPGRGMESLKRYAWPGNIRELKNVIEHAMIMNKGTILDLEPPSPAFPQEVDPGTLENAERRCILRALERTRWRVAGKDGAAQLLGLKRTTLQAKMKTLGITRPSP